MNQNTVKSFQENRVSNKENNCFFTETIEVGRISPLAFLKAGERSYPKNHFYWQNANQTLTIVGLGKASVLESSGQENRYAHIAEQWEKLCSKLSKTKGEILPTVFGGFSFDPQNKKSSEWDRFPSAYFVLPSIQLMTKKGKSYVMINVVTGEEDEVEQIEKVRMKRDELIHSAQLNEFETIEKPTVTALHEVEKEAYQEAVYQTREKIRQKEAEKVVIARSIQLSFDAIVPSVTAIHHIANEQQESYHFGLQKDGQLFFGATPERLVEVTEGQVYSACVAGSIKRGKTAEEDIKMGNLLLNDPKNREEHQYVVDMISQVFHAHCKDVEIPNEPSLMKIRDIQHLFTPVEATMKDGESILQLVQALHPTPALGGLPTEESLAIIREEENLNRGFYAGPIGWLDTEGNGEFAVAIRSALLMEDEAYLYAGGGIVSDSDVADEYEETWIKFRPVLRALGGHINDK